MAPGFKAKQPNGWKDLVVLVNKFNSTFTNNPKYFGKKSDEVVEKDDKRSSFKVRKKFKKRHRPKKFSFKKHKKK